MFISSFGCPQRISSHRGGMHLPFSISLECYSPFKLESGEVATVKPGVAHTVRIGNNAEDSTGTEGTGKELATHTLACADWVLVPQESLPNPAGGVFVTSL